MGVRGSPIRAPSRALPCQGLARRTRLVGGRSRVTDPGTLASPALSGASSPYKVGWWAFEGHGSGHPREPCPVLSGASSPYKVGWWAFEGHRSGHPREPGQGLARLAIEIPIPPPLRGLGNRRTQPCGVLTPPPIYTYMDIVQNNPMLSTMLKTENKQVQ